MPVGMEVHVCADTCKLKNSNAKENSFFIGAILFCKDINLQ